MRLFTLEVIGTRLDISVDTSLSCDKEFLRIRERLEKFEIKFSRFIRGNWLSDLNTSRSATLDSDGYTMLTFALELAEKTKGYFDPTVGSILSGLGYGLPRSRKSNNYGSYRDIYIEGNEVRLGGDAELEFGGVGKGYLLDVIKGLLDSHERYLINFGGDLYGKGEWRVGLEHPHNPEEAIGVINLKNMFLACSSGSKRKWGEHHHLIDPHSGESARSVIASYIESGKSGMRADGYATTLCAMPYHEACKLLEVTPEIEGVLLSAVGKYYRSSGSTSVVFGEKNNGV